MTLGWVFYCFQPHQSTVLYCNDGPLRGRQESAEKFRLEAQVGPGIDQCGGFYTTSYPNSGNYTIMEHNLWENNYKFLPYFYVGIFFKLIE